MKRLFLSALAMCMCLTAFSQKGDGEKVSFKYLELPEVPFEPEISTYSSNVDIPYGLSSYENREAIVKSLLSAMKIEGYEGVEENGQIQVNAIYHAFSTRSPEYLKREVEEKRDDKKVKVTYHYYRMEYKLPVELQVSLNGEILESFYVNNSADYSSYETSQFKSYSELADSWNKGKGKITSELKGKAFSDRVSSINRFLNVKYGYRKSATTEKLYTFVTKKHNYEDYDKAMVLAKDAFAAYSDSLIYPVDEFKAKIGEAIVIWNKALEESDVDNKKSRVNEKITGLTLKNLTFSYIWLNDFENANKCIEKGKELDKGDGWVKEFASLAKQKEEKLTSYEEVNPIAIN